MCECAGRRFCVLDGSCGMPVETVDARLGIMGFVGTVRIMGNRWGVIGWQFRVVWALG